MASGNRLARAAHRLLTVVAAVAVLLAVPAAPAAADVPLNTAPPTVTGTARDGQTLTADPGTWTGTAPITFDHQWVRCDGAGANCADIAGATDTTYVLTAADVGNRVRVRVTGTNGEGSDSAESDLTGVVAAIDPPVNTALPTVTGTARDGQTLTADPGTWTGTEPITFEYQWRRCDGAGANCVDIAGATGTTRVLAPADVGHRIRVEVTATNEAAGVDATSDPTGVVTADPPANTAAPTVSGTATDGNTLSATSGTWTGTAPITYAYQWLRCDGAGANCVDIASATADDYTLTSADVASRIRVKVTATNDGGSAEASSSPTAVVAAAPPVNTVAPSISGTELDGGLLTVDLGTWTGTVPITFSYQWVRCDAAGANCTGIAGAAAATYTLTGDDIDHRIYALVIATNDVDSAGASSALTGLIGAAPPANTALPTVTGTPTDGKVLTATPGTWSGTAPITYAYQWVRCDADGDNCTDITGATEATYTLTADDVTHRIRVEVTATNVAGDDDALSDPTAAVAAAPPVNSVKPTITGDAYDLDTLTVDPGTWTGTPEITFTYQWYRCDKYGNNCVPVAGATGGTYLLANTDVGAKIGLKVTGTNAGGTADAYSVLTPVVQPVSLAVAGAPYWRGWDIARGTALLPDSDGGYVLDGWGGIHRFRTNDNSTPPALTSTPYSKGWDIARDLTLLPGGTGGYVLDGWGGLHRFAVGGNPLPGGVSGGPYWKDWDIARDVAILPNGTGGYVLDGWGGIHRFAIGANPLPPPVSGGPYWKGWDIARGIALTADGKGGYVLDGWGGIHRFSIGANPRPAPITGHPYWKGWDIARSLTIPAGGGPTGLVLDGWGGLHRIAVPRPS